MEHKLAKVSDVADQEFDFVIIGMCLASMNKSSYDLNLAHHRWWRAYKTVLLQMIRAVELMNNR